MRDPVLLLDRSYFPISTVRWRKAIDLVHARQKAETLVLYDEGDHHAMSVIRLLYRNIPKHMRYRKPTFTKRNVLIRDNYTCRYCGVRTRKNLTVDHVIPRCRGGDNTYENCVAACVSCNNKKGHNLPDEAGMPLKHIPVVPIVGGLVDVQAAPIQWHQFLQGYVIR